MALYTVGGWGLELMVKAVFTTKLIPSYDDLPEERYHFPRSYLNQVAQAVGDWIVYYEPRRASSDLASTGGRQVYFATAKLREIIEDPNRRDYFYALVTDYLPFTRLVPFNEGASYYESALQKPDGSTNKGAFGRSVRVLPDLEYQTIWHAGFGHLIGLEARPRLEPDLPEDAWPALTSLREERVPYQPEVGLHVERETVTQLVSRSFRDRAFSSAVKTAYGDACGVTGLKIINGGGRSEVQAAHIKPVEHQGPDSVRNGIALCGTAHWMFDRGLIAINDDMSILLAKDRVPDAAAKLFHADMRLVTPERSDLRPHPKFLAYHRHHIFKG